MADRDLLRLLRFAASTVASNPRSRWRRGTHVPDPTPTGVPRVDAFPLDGSAALGGFASCCAPPRWRHPPAPTRRTQADLTPSSTGKSRTGSGCSRIPNTRGCSRRPMTRSWIRGRGLRNGSRSSPWSECSKIPTLFGDWRRTSGKPPRGITMPWPATMNPATTSRPRCARGAGPMSYTGRPAIGRKEARVKTPTICAITGARASPTRSWERKRRMSPGWVWVWSITASTTCTPGGMTWRLGSVRASTDPANADGSYEEAWRRNLGSSRPPVRTRSS